MKSRRLIIAPSAKTSNHPGKNQCTERPSMSALGQMQTNAVQNGMSALPPKADICGATRDVRFGPITDMSHSVDHLIGGIQEPFRNRQTECLSGLEIDVQLGFGGLLHRQVGGLVALENPAGIDAG